MFKPFLFLTNLLSTIHYFDCKISKIIEILNPKNKKNARKRFRFTIF